jgi:diguanylate cyclase (GGDEF)-like protein
MFAQVMLPADYPWQARASCLLLNAVFALWAVYWIHHSYRMGLSQLEVARAGADETAALHLRTIETLALAIDGKDHSSREDVRRVGAYAVEIGKEMGLPDAELKALCAAAVLRDIGKLEVPEHIVSKPGQLTPAEFEKMKTHPVTGCQILEQVGFPYPVATIVRSHHEKWDGTGYPDGLRGEEIPQGARILAAADCLVALLTDRPYRRALSLDEAVKAVRSAAGSSLDPQVVRILEQHCREFDRLEQRHLRSSHKSLHVMDSDSKPASATGSESASQGQFGGKPDFTSSVAASAEVAQELFELTRDLGKPLNLSETLSILEKRLARMVPYQSMAVYICRDGSLAPSFARGLSSQFFSGMPIGEGVSGRVAETREPIVNGNPASEPGCRGDQDASGSLRSALSVPLEDSLGLVGVLTLYHRENGAFTNEHLRLVQSVAYGLAQAVQMALQSAGAEMSSATDSLTGLPSARSLFLHLDQELARSKRTDQPLTVLVCDLSGLREVIGRFGRLQGDLVLKLVAQKFREACREYDYISRMSESEFVLVLADRSPDLVDVVRSRLTRAVAEAGRELFCDEAILRAAFGEGQYPRDGKDAEELLVAADRRIFANRQDRKTAEEHTECVCALNSETPPLQWRGDGSPAHRSPN